MPLLTPSVNGFWKKICTNPLRLESQRASQAEALCLSALAQARTPHFYETWDVPDTIEGRFDCAVLHICLLLRHLKGPPAQLVFDAFFAYTELTLREMGVSDLKVGKPVKNCAKFFYGALKAYEDSLGSKACLEEALARNLYGNASCRWLKEVAAYVRMCDQHLKGQDFKRSITWPLPKCSPNVVGGTYPKAG